MTLFGFFISLKTDLQLSQRTKASSNRSSDSGDVTQQVIFYTQIKGDVENLITYYGIKKVLICQVRGKLRLIN